MGAALKENHAVDTVACTITLCDSFLTRNHSRTRVVCCDKIWPYLDANSFKWLCLISSGCKNLSWIECNQGKLVAVCTVALPRGGGDRCFFIANQSNEANKPHSLHMSKQSKQKCKETEQAKMLVRFSFTVVCMSHMITKKKSDQCISFQASLFALLGLLGLPHLLGSEKRNSLVYSV